MNREQLIAAMGSSAPTPVPVDVEGWGVLHVRPPTVAEVDEANEATVPEGGKRQRLARSAARVLCDEAGVRLFDPVDEADVALLAAQPWWRLQKVLQAVDSGKGGGSGN